MELTSKEYLFKIGDEIRSSYTTNRGKITEINNEVYSLDNGCINIENAILIKPSLPSGKIPVQYAKQFLKVGQRIRFDNLDGFVIPDQSFIDRMENISYPSKYFEILSESGEKIVSDYNPVFIGQASLQNKESGSSNIFLSPDPYEKLTDSQAKYCRQRDLEREAQQKLQEGKITMNEYINLINPNKNNQKPTLMNRITKFIKDSLLSEKERNFRKAEVKDSCGQLTAEGKEAFFSWLFDRNEDDFHKEVVVPMLEEQEKNKE